MKKFLNILPHFFVPSLILVFVASYYPMSDLLQSLGTSEKRMESFEYLLKNKPVEAAACGTEYSVKIEQSRGNTVSHLDSALETMLVEIGLIVFLLSVLRERSVYKKLKNS
jgi:hypothetical protein